jgi:hypothetical protein
MMGRVRLRKVFGNPDFFQPSGDDLRRDPGSDLRFVRTGRKLYPDETDETDETRKILNDNRDLDFPSLSAGCRRRTSGFSGSDVKGPVEQVVRPGRPNKT